MSVERTRRRTTRVRLTVGFAMVLALFAAAMVTSLLTLSSVSSAERTVARLDRAKHAGHRVAALVREQYIHQAQFISDATEARRREYEQVAAETRKATITLQGLAETDRERELAKQLRVLAKRSDVAFRREVLSAPAGTATVKSRRDQRQRLRDMVRNVVDLNHQLTTSLEQRSQRALRSAEALRRRARLILISCFAFAILLATVVGTRIVRSVTVPLRELERGVERVASGDLRTHVRVDADDELGALAATFNEMMDDLDENQRQLVRARQLASIGQLAAGVAHEINNPLGVILGYVKLMQRKEDADAEVLGIIEDEAKQCQAIVSALRELARPVSLSMTEFDLARMTRDTISRLEESGALANVHIVQPPANERLSIVADEAQLKQVFTNILTNAVDASPTGGRVTVGLSTTGDRVQVRVTDEGPGLDPEARERAFDPFFTTKPEGLGLGLAIAFGIAEAHGGGIDLVSGDKLGTTVTLWLPVSGRQGSGG